MARLQDRTCLLAWREGPVSKRNVTDTSLSVASRELPTFEINDMSDTVRRPSDPRIYRAGPSLDFPFL